MRITFLSDTMCEPLLLEASRTGQESYDFHDAFGHIAPLIAESDFVICNLETPLAGPKAKYVSDLFSFNAPIAFAEALRDNGVDMVLTANNHCLDRGVDGAINTLHALDAIGLAHTGTFLAGDELNYALVNINGRTVAIISYTYGTNFVQNGELLGEDSPLKVNLLSEQDHPPGLRPSPPSKNILKQALLKLIPHEKRIAIKRRLGMQYYQAYKDDFFEVDAVADHLAELHDTIVRAKKEADLVIFCPHMGGQFNEEPGAFSKLVVENAVNWGVDAIISSHPHVVQKAEIIDGVPCFFSLGNFAMSPNSVYLLPEHHPELGIVAHLDIDDDEVKPSFSIVASVETNDEPLSVHPLTELLERATGEERANLIEAARDIVRTVSQGRERFDVKTAEYPIPRTCDSPMPSNDDARDGIEGAPMLSFIIAAYNAQDTLVLCVDSILEQGVNDIEVVIIDDGSVDETGRIADLLEERDERVKVVHQSNEGVAGARNTGIMHASGAYLFFCDADDEILPSSLPQVMSAINACRADMITFDHAFVIGDEHQLKRVFPDEFETIDRNTMQTIQQLVLQIQPSRIAAPEFACCYGLGGASWHHVFKSNLVERNGIRFDSSLNGLLEDGLFVMEALEHAKSLAYFPIPFYCYHAASNSSTHGYHPDFVDRCAQVHKKFREYGERMGKDSAFFNTLDARMVYLVKKLCLVDFLCPGNPLPERARYKSFVKTVSSEPFRSAVTEFDGSQLLSKSERLQASLLKKGRYKTYWLLRKLKARLSR